MKIPHPASLISGTNEQIEATLRIVRWDEVQQLWIFEGGVVDIANNTVTAPVSGYGNFYTGKTAKRYFI